MRSAWKRRRRLALIFAALAFTFLSGVPFRDPSSLARGDEPKGGVTSLASSGDASFIDDRIMEAWNAAEVTPAQIASDPEFLRRAYLDILGRIPSMEEATAFLGSNERDKRSRLIDRLLAHPDYPKHFGTIWTNLLVGREPESNRVDRSALAAWLRRQFAQESPWVEIVEELVTASGSNKENGAANFTLAHLNDGAVNLTSFTTRLFLGQQIQCTQCHDHPSNSWKQADFWGINAFFKGVRTRDVYETDGTGARVVAATEVRDVPTDAYSTFEKRNAMIGIAFPAYLDGRKISQGTDVIRRAELARFLTDSDDLQLARAFVNRMWGHFLGRGIVEPVDDFGDHNEPSHPELLDELARDFQAHGYDIKRLIRQITASRPYHLSSERSRKGPYEESLFASMLLKPMTPEQLFDSLLVATDAHKAGGSAETDSRRDRWLRQFIFTFANDEAIEGNIFQGTIPQALMMMNGDLIAEATSGKPGSLLARIRDQAMRRPRGQGEAMITSLYLAALSRPPSRSELSQASRFLQSSGDPVAVMEDLFWALLNSNEFVLNH